MMLHPNELKLAGPCEWLLSPVLELFRSDEWQESNLFWQSMPTELCVSWQPFRVVKDYNQKLKCTEIIGDKFTVLAPFMEIFGRLSQEFPWKMYDELENEVSLRWEQLHEFELESDDEGFDANVFQNGEIKGSSPIFQLIERSDFNEKHKELKDKENTNFPMKKKLQFDYLSSPETDAEPKCKRKISFADDELPMKKQKKEDSDEGIETFCKKLVCDMSQEEKFDYFNKLYH